MKRKEISRSDEDQPRKKTKIDVTNTNLFDLLPDEILREILSYLNEQDIRWTRLVNSRLFKLIDIRHFNIGVILASEMSELTRVFGRYDRPLGLTFRKPDFLYRGSHLSHLTQLTQLVSLAIGQDIYRINILKSLTNLQSLTTLYVSLTDIQHHTRLTNLVVHKVLIDSEQLPMFPPHLRHLSSKEIHYFDGESKGTTRRPNIKHLGQSNKQKLMPGIKCHLTGLESLSTGTAVADLPVSTMTALTVLAYYNVEDDDNDIQVKWDITHLTNLRHLELNHQDLLSHNSLQPFKLLESFTLQRTTMTNHLTQLISTQITQLDICIGSSHVVKHITVFSNLRRLSLTGISKGMELDLAELSHLTRLTSLTCLEYRDRLKNIESINNLTKLMELELVMRRPSDSTQVINLRNLTRLTRLAVKQSIPQVDVSNMTNLMHLEYDRNQASLGLSSLHNLTTLHCNWSHGISNLTSLRKLRLAHNSPIRDEDVMALSSLTQLTSLNAFTHGSGEHLTRLTRLQYLECTANTGNKKILARLKTQLIYCAPLLYDFS